MMTQHLSVTTVIHGYTQNATKLPSENTNTIKTILTRNLFAKNVTNVKFAIKHLLKIIYLCNVMSVIEESIISAINLTEKTMTNGRKMKVKNYLLVYPA